MDAVATWDNSVYMSQFVEQGAGTHLVSGIRGVLGKGVCGQVRVGAPDPSLTGNGGMLAVSE